MTTDNPDDEKVGFGRPPKKTRFQKGQSGNPKGRTKKQKDPESLLTKLLDQTVAVTVNGDRKLMTNLEVILATLVKNAQKGNRDAILLIFKVLERKGTPPSFDTDFDRAELDRALSDLQNKPSTQIDEE